MKQLIKTTTFCFLIISLSFTSYCQHSSDAWETRLNNIQPPDKVLITAGIDMGMIVGEIGAGRGRYAVKIAEKVGLEGLVYANDIDEGDLDYLEYRCKRDDVTNIKMVLGEIYDPKFPIKNLDVLFLINTYHHLDDPVKLLTNAIKYLKPEGTLIIVEADPEKEEHHYAGESTKKEKVIEKVKEAGYTFIKVETYLVRDNIYIFKK
jgi:ubiquinone/menaquinone biosynthesis C-methylase UbiE